MKMLLLCLLLLCLGTDIWLFGISITRREQSRAIYFSILCIGTALYLLGYLLEILSSTYDGALVALKVQNAGIPFSGPFALLCTLTICRYRFYKRWMGIAATCYCFVMFLVVLTNEWHYLYYPTIEYLPVGDMYYLSLGHGPLYYVQQGIAILCSALSFTALIIRFIQWPRRACRQLWLIVMGISVPFVANVLYFTRAIPHYIDPTPFAMLGSLLFIMVSILKYKLYDLVPVASETAIENMDCAVLILDDAWCYQSSNGYARKLFPALDRLYDCEYMGKVDNWPESLLSDPGPEGVDFQLEVEGAVRSYHANVTPVTKMGKNHYGWSVMIRDITHTLELMAQLQTLATTDFLTGIYNRRHFNDVAGQKLALARREQLPAVLAMFDLDHFKGINDTYGHKMGDDVLVAAVNAVRTQLRPYDVFGRYGGEEFVIFSVGIEGPDAEGFAQRLCDAVAAIHIPCGGDENSVDGNEKTESFPPKKKPDSIRITASFGVVEMPLECSLEEAIAAADKAMYCAKQDGRNCVRVGQVRTRQVRPI